MENFQYLIIGAGMTGDAAVRGIRELDPDGLIGMVGAETDPPYSRPPLTKALWKGKSVDSIWRKTEAMKVSLHLGRKIVSLDPQEMRAADNQGQVYHAEKILLATGGTVRQLPFGGERILYYRTLADYRRLLALSAAKTSFAVIGGGFIGSEIAAALAMNGRHVTMLFPEDGIGALVYPPDLSQFLNDFFRQKGVEVLTGELLTGAEPAGDGILLRTKSGREVRADGAVAGIGIQPNIELARQAGLQTGSGITVDEHLATSQPGIYAAGDVAEFFSPALGKRLRVEHEDNANTMGRLAGRNMAGADEPYHHLPFFYSDLFDLGYEAVGQLDARLTVVPDWQEPYKKGVLYYLEGQRIRGILLWDVWKKLDDARRLIAAPGPFRPEDLKGAIGF
jgi:3-phenylpropionate/trans-cinnamate dioxygenase ferredoxin reductase subunit